MGRISAVGIPRAGFFAALVAIAAFVAAGEPRAWSLRAAGSAVPPAGGTIVGVATTKEGTPPAIRATIDPAICGSTVPDESVMVMARRASSKPKRSAWRLVQALQSGEIEGLQLVDPP